MPDQQPLLEIRDLRITFRTRRSTVTAVDGLSLTVAPGEVLGVVGESGSGKSVSMLGLLGLIRDPNATVTGEVVFRGQNLVGMSDKKLRAIRGRQIAMIFQDPMTALTPVYTVGWHIAEQLRAHEKMSRSAARTRAIELLEEVGIPDASRRVDSFPHEFSGGMRQRAVIAMALAWNPGLLIADEPTTALDVTTQAQILDLMRRLREDHGSAIILITHDMGVVSDLADRVLVMYGGRPVEQGPRRAVFHSPRHPYTRGLLRSVPRVAGKRLRRLAVIPGSPISPDDRPDGCPFAPRCESRHEACDEAPPLTGPPDHPYACWLPIGPGTPTPPRAQAEPTTAVLPEPTAVQAEPGAAVLPAPDNANPGPDPAAPPVPDDVHVEPDAAVLPGPVTANSRPDAGVVPRPDTGRSGLDPVVLAGSDESGVRPEPVGPGEVSGKGEEG